MADASPSNRMAPQTIAAVLADVDGTLVTKSKALTPRAIKAIEQLHERGVLFAITSGRPPRGMRMLVHPLDMRGPMIERMSHYYQIPLDQIATLGDQVNDVLMFRRSGLSVAMGNASEQVQREATYVTTSNEDEGFARAIEEFILPRAVAAPMVPPAG